MKDKPPKISKPPKPPFRPLAGDQQVRPIISDQQKLAIGAVIEQWSKLENGMDDLIWGLLNLEFEVGKLITNRMDAIGKIKLLRQIGLKFLTTEQFHNLSPHLDMVNMYREDRNFIVHGAWGTLLPDNVPVCSSLRLASENPDEVLTETFPATRMQALHRGIQETGAVIWALANQVLASRNKSAEPHPEAE